MASMMIWSKREPGLHDEAIKACNEAIWLDPNFAATCSYKALTLEGFGKGLRSRGGLRQGPGASV